MKDDAKTILLLLALLIVGTITSLWYISGLEAEKHRLENNQQALLKDCDTLRTENGKSMARVLELEPASLRSTARSWKSRCMSWASKTSGWSTLCR